MRRSGLRAVALVTLTLLGAGCNMDDLNRPRPPLPLAVTTIGLAATSTGADAGDTVIIAATVGGAGPEPVGAFQGYLRFDPDKLEYLGQLPGRTFAIVNDRRSQAGELRFATLDIRGLPEHMAYFGFRVLHRGYDPGLSIVPEGLAYRSGTRVKSYEVSRVLGVISLPADGVTPTLTLNDWRRVLQADYPVARPAYRVPGEYRLNLRYGDATLDGMIDIIGDAFYLANVSVGNAQLILGTDAPSRDAVIAGNVDPANLPGLGEVGDGNPPGRNSDGSYSIDIFDAAMVANKAVGNNPPIAGDLIPGRGPVPGNRVIVNSNILVGTTRTFTHDTIYELQGMVNVEGSATLVIEAGTRIEGDVATRGALVVRRGGMIDARGTRLEPIVLTCNAVVKTRGCWGGVALSGFSLLNNGEILPGGSDVNGCPQKIGWIHPGYYGGCLVQNSSGTLRYVRVEYAGMANPGTGAVPGLALLGVGSSTTIDSIQVYGSLGDGIYVGGGTVNLRNVLSTNNAGDGIRWEDGWVGKAQFVIVQQDPDNDRAIHGSNYAVNPNAGPRSNPQLYNVTISGPPMLMGATGAGILLENGTDVVLRNLVVYRAGGAGLDIQGNESCTRASASTPTLLVENSIFFASNPDFSADADCIDEAVYGLAAARNNRVIDPGLVAIASTRTPDFRPTPGSPALVGFSIPPSDGFFDLTATYIGAVAPASALGNNIPWYSGWTKGWMGAP